MFYSASSQSIVIYTGHEIQLTLVKAGESNVCRALGCSCPRELCVLQVPHAC